MNNETSVECFNCGADITEDDQYITMPNDFGIHYSIGKKWCGDCAERFRRRIDED
jgi:hypothetical protein